VDAAAWNKRKELRSPVHTTLSLRSTGQMAQLKKRGIMAWMHAPSYRFLFFWLLSAKMGTKIVRVATFSIYNP